MRKEKTEKAEEPVKSLTPDERKRLLTEGIKKTVFPSFVALAFALLFLFTAEKIEGKSWLLILLLVIIVSYYAQKLLYPLIGVRVNEFETKDWMYVEFFTVVYFFIFWTILLNAGALSIASDPSAIPVGINQDLNIKVTSSGIGIEGAAVHLRGDGVNMSSSSGKDGSAYFYNVNATGNITAIAKKTGYASGSLNITVQK